MPTPVKIAPDTMMTNRKLSISFVAIEILMPFVE
jgi:hypothetical protein